jgi:hypothetical protein
MCLGLVLQACTLAESSRLVVPEPQSVPPDEPAIERGVKDLFRQVKLTGTPEVSELRKAIASAPADWLLCVRSSVPPFQPYAMFFKGNSVVDYRLAVLYDDCAREMYIPLMAEGQ